MKVLNIWCSEFNDVQGFRKANSEKPCATLTWSSYFKAQLVDVAAQDNLIQGRQRYQNLTKRFFKRINFLPYF